MGSNSMWVSDFFSEATFLLTFNIIVVVSSLTKYDYVSKSRIAMNFSLRFCMILAEDLLFIFSVLRFHPP